MSTIDSHLLNAPTLPVLKVLLPVQAVSATRDTTRRAAQHVATTLVKAEVRGQLETRADLLRRGILDEGGGRNRNLSAVNAYLSLQVQQEREEIRELMGGVDAYA